MLRKHTLSYIISHIGILKLQQEFGDFREGKERNLRE